tara:strand:- start:951 stop:1514 length:564 start_codon:yes stop_codon:yes gene_type:complete
MGQDLRNLFGEDYKEQNIKMSESHEVRFLKRLDKELPNEGKSSHFSFFNIAASVIVLLGLSYGAFQFFQAPLVTPKDQPIATNLKTLGDVSPDLKKVEDYYLASINLELSKVQLTPENKELFDGYVERLKELNDEYDTLTKELTDNGPNEETLNALIDNLKFRLNLVKRLKEKLQEFNDDSFTQESI